MADPCPCPPESGSRVCKSRLATIQAPPAPGVCATCGQAGKRVEDQTVKAAFGNLLDKPQQVGCIANIDWSEFSCHNPYLHKDAPLHYDIHAIAM